MSQFIEMFEGEKYPRLSLDEICKEWSKGQGFKKDDICEDGETQCIHYGELFTKYGPVINEVISRTSVEKKKTSKKGDILFPASDVTPNGLARCSMLPFDNVILGGDIIILRPKDKYNPAYLSYAINQQTSQLLTRVNGGVVKHMSAKGLKTVEIPIPPMDKQGEYIQIAEQADKSEFVGCKSQFFEMFEGDEYPLIKLGDYTDLTWGDTNTTKNSYVTEGYLAYSASGPDGKLDHYDYDCEGIVLSAIGADCGKTWFASGKWSCIKNTIRFWSTFDDLDNRFLYFATREKDFWPRRGGAQPFIPQGDARNCSIPLPPICLQRKFVEIAEQADKSEYYN